MNLTTVSGIDVPRISVINDLGLEVVEVPWIVTFKP